MRMMTLRVGYALVLGIAGGAALLIAVVGLSIWLVSGRKKAPEPTGPPDVATATSKPSDSGKSLPPITKEPKPKPNEPTTKSMDPPKSKQPEVDKENTLYFDKNRGIARFTPKLSMRSAAGERLTLIVLIASVGGRSLDEKIAAGHYRGDMASTWSPLTKASMNYSTVLSDGKVVGQVKSFSDSDGKAITDGKLIEFSLSVNEASQQVTAALGSYKSVGGNHEFVQFLTPIAVLGGFQIVPAEKQPDSPPREAPKLDPSKLVGKWEEMALNAADGQMIAAPGRPMVEFTKDHKLILTEGGLGGVRKSEGTYKLNGDKLTLNLKESGRESEITVIVTRLKDDELETETPDGTKTLVTAFKKVKPKPK